jgi:beta-glucosidase
VQLYIRDPVATMVQPVRRLRNFRRVSMAPRDSVTVSFFLGADDLGFWTNDPAGEFVVEPGDIEIIVGVDSVGGISRKFTVEPVSSLP